MAIRFRTDYSHIRAIVSYSSPQVIAPVFQKARAITDRAYLKASVSSQIPRVSVAARSLQTVIGFQDLQARGIKLDSHRHNLNRYIRDDFVTPLDQIVLDSSLSASESLSLTDVVQSLTEKGLSDSATAGDYANILLSAVRSFSDSSSIADAIQSFQVSKGLAETLGFTEATSFGVSTNLADIGTVTEASDISFGKAPSDSASVADNFSLVASWTRTVFETPSAVDSSSLLVDKALSETPSVTDSFSKTFAYSPAFSEHQTVQDSSTLSVVVAPSDTPTVSDAFTYTAVFIRSLADSASVSESLSLSTRTTISSILNARALNTGPLNN